MEWIRVKYNVNGYEVEANYTKQNQEMIFCPLVENIQRIAQTKNDRVIVFLAAPPACGKSTLVIYLCELAKSLGYHNMTWIGMDGFHYTNAYLKSHKQDGSYLYDYKGSPESFDLKKLNEYLHMTKQQDCDWPIYDRTLHEPREKAVHIDKQIILIEGNYLLLDEDGWRDVATLCDYSIFIKAEEPMLQKRLIDRKTKGIGNREEAIQFYEKSDKKNIQRVIDHALDADVELYLDTAGVFHIITNTDFVTKDSK